MGDGRGERRALGVTCPACGAVFAVAESHLGRKGSCPSCQEELPVSGEPLPVAPRPRSLSRQGRIRRRRVLLKRVLLLAVAVALAWIFLGGGGLGGDDPAAPGPGGVQAQRR
jgi:predicted Zn finger-like uncharacterized protein